MEVENSREVWSRAKAVRYRLGREGPKVSEDAYSLCPSLPWAVPEPATQEFQKFAFVFPWKLLRVQEDFLKGANEDQCSTPPAWSTFLRKKDQPCACISPPFTSKDPCRWVL